MKMILVCPTFQDTTGIGGYRDLQLQCLLLVDGVYRYGEIQINLEEFVAIKSGKTTGGGHTPFKIARSIEGYSAATLR